MPRADVDVVGAGLAGLATATALADAGASVQVLATGYATTHWAAGGLDAGVAPSARSAQAAVDRLAEQPGHPYRIVGSALPAAVDWFRSLLGAEGLELNGELTDPLRPIPTAIGATRPAAILPLSMAAALPTWQPGETLVVCGPAGFRDFWPDAIAASLRRATSWRGQPAPERVEAVAVELPGLGSRHNLSGLDLARAFDDPAWRGRALEAMAMAIGRVSRGPGRVALPAVVGLEDHRQAWAAAVERLPLTPFEVALVPPSVPGLRLYQALQAALRRRRGRLQVGEAVRGEVGPGRRVDRLVAPAAARELVVSVGAVVLATGGIVGGGIVGRDDGSLVESVLSLPVEAPLSGPLLLADPFDPSGHPIEKVGIRTDDRLRPLAPGGRGQPLASNVRVVGSLLAGQRYLRERCGDGVAIASALVAARSLAGPTASSGRRAERVSAAAGRIR